MSNINGIPFIWDSTQDNILLGSLFPQSSENSQNLNNTAFPQSASAGPYHGETIRDMSHVSPLVIQKQTGLSVEEIKSRYFTDATTQQGEGTDIICDVNTEFEGIKMQFDDFKYRDGTYAYTVYLFYSKDAIKLAEAYECIKLKEKQVVFFIEDNSDDISERFGAIKIAPGLAKTLRSGLDNDLKDNNNVYGTLKNFLPDLTDDDIKELLNEEKLQYTGTVALAHILKISSGMLSLVLGLPMLVMGSSATGNIFSMVGDTIGSLAEAIDKAKFDDYRWNPEADKENEDGSTDDSYNKEKDFSPVLFSGLDEALNDETANAKLQESIKSAAASLLRKLEAQDTSIRSLLGISKNFKPGQDSGIKEFAYSKYAVVLQTIKNKLNELEQLDFASLAKMGLRMLNAFLCGLWNGLVDAVSSLVLLVKYIFDALGAIQEFLKNATTELPKLTEHFDNVLQGFKAINFSKIITRIKQGFINYVTNTTIDGTTLIKIAYFAGVAYGFIISLIIEIIAGILISGGAISVEAVVARLATLFTDLLKLAPALAKALIKKTTKIAVRGLQAIYKMLSEITSFLKKGTDELLKIVDEMFDSFRVYVKESRGSLNSQIPLLGKKELELYNNITKTFYKAFKKLLLKLSNESVMLYKWKRLKVMDGLSKANLEDLLALKRKYAGDKFKNAATMKVKLRIKGKEITLEYKAIAGKEYGSVDNLCKNPDLEYIAQQLEISPQKLKELYLAETNNGAMGRFYDTEHKIFAAFDDDIAKFKAKYGKDVEVLDVNLKSLLEPCNSCKRQILLRKEYYNIKRIKVEAAKLKNNMYAKSINDLSNN